MPGIVRWPGILLALAICLSACEENIGDDVVQACIRDGQALKFCQCTARGMERELGVDGYVIFRDMIVLSDKTTPDPNEIVVIMEEHGLAPELLTNVLQAIENSAEKVHALCSP